jgi:primosomal protein N' (replication factor Y) (superfamily II helicase)
MFAEVLLPQKVGEKKDTLTYEIPENLKIEIGQIVEVPLRNRLTKGIIFGLSAETPPYKTKPVARIVENAPHLRTWQIDLLKWISAYYFAPLFKTLKLFLPVAFVKKKTLRAELPAELIPYSFNPKHTLNNQQKTALEKFEQTGKTVTLLHGITGSGKTEIYMHITNKYLLQDKQVLLLVPEISLTPQTLAHFKGHFGQQAAVIHSQLTSKQKQQAWMRIHSGEAKIIIGSRSALFAPFLNLGCIILDEEHDGSYKQDQSPRYNTLHVAEKIAKTLGIKLLAGSATPTIETYHKAKSGEYELLELADRAPTDNAGLPVTRIVDLREEIRKKNFSIFSEILQERMRARLGAGEQVIMFLNRRGAASAVICRECGYISKCEPCGVPMTYHNRYTVENSVYHAERLICHHCGRIEKVPHACPNCKSVFIRYIGVGTQRVEDEINRMDPKIRTLRADRDTTGKKDSFKKIYETFLKREADVLIGTQMIAFGLHIPGVNLVGIVLADMGLTVPNFRSAEKTFQLITQVAGRAGREKIGGEVVIQTYLPDHYAIRRAAAHDYLGFFEDEIKIRKSLSYPPFNKLIKVTIADTGNKVCQDKAMDLFNELKGLNEGQTHSLTYYPALIPKLKNRYRWHVLISGPQPEALLRKSRLLEGAIIDVDPLSTV